MTEEVPGQKRRCPRHRIAKGHVRGLAMVGSEKLFFARPDAKHGGLFISVPNPPPWVLS